MDWVEWLGKYYPILIVIAFIAYRMFFTKKENKVEETPYMDSPMMDDIFKKDKELVSRLRQIDIENRQNWREYQRVQKKGYILKKEKEMIEIMLKKMREK